MNAKTIRRIIGITTLVLWGVVVCSVFLDEGVRIAYQLDGWAFGIALMLTPVYAIMLTIHIGRGKHWLIRTAAWLGCAMVIYVCGVLFFVSTMLTDHRAWSNKDYVVYSEFGGFIEPNNFVLYQRDGFFDRKLYRLRCEDWGQNEKSEYTMYIPLDLIKEDFTYSPYFEADSICHATAFYRLSDGHLYSQDKNDSLISLINNQ
ncbi:MAG: hypothetical protein IJ524_08880 [Bacteroidales bacterium]|nr:hypothetical protein [Bacteroidales bacterium]